MLSWNRDENEIAWICIQFDTIIVTRIICH
nr:MAG TPA: hypothetical protein [Caudoviricetes sp.]